MAKAYQNSLEITTGHNRQIQHGLPYVGIDTQNSGNPNLVGLDPRIIDKSDLLALMHPTSPIRAIRAKCLDCCGGSESEARKCTATSCPLWPLRMGKNVYHAKARQYGE